MKKIIIVGGRGDGTIIASIINDCRLAGQDVECVGFLNDNEKTINDYPVLGGIVNKDWQHLDEEILFISALSKVKLGYERHILLKELNIPIKRFATIIHPTSVVSEKVSLGNDVVLMPFSYVGPNVILGDHTKLAVNSYVGHDSVLGNMVYVANNTSVGSYVNIENGAHLGSNSTVLESVNIGKYSVIGIGSVVLRDVKEFSIVAGSPAKLINYLEWNVFIYCFL